MEETKITPQTRGALVRDPSGSMFGIQTPDGNMVLLSAPLAHQFALEILSITALAQSFQNVTRKQQ